MESFFILGLQIHALHTASTHVSPDHLHAQALIHKEQIQRLIGKVEQKAIPWCRSVCTGREGRVKCEIALARGRPSMTSATIKDREASVGIERAMKAATAETRCGHLANQVP